MNLLITAGNTHAPVDQVRVITNIFTGRTGASIARTAWGRGHTVTVLTSHPDTLDDMPAPGADPNPRLAVVPYRTFDDLTGLLPRYLKTGAFDAVVHSAAVSDFLCAGVYAPEPGTFFNARTNEWEGNAGPPAMGDRRAGKLSSSEPELWVRMVRAPKLIDRFRTAWGYRGLLVKFKLEVGLSDHQLLDVAENSRAKSAADLIVANTLDGAAHWAYLGPVEGRYEKVGRRELAERLVLVLEDIHRTERGSWHDG